VNGLAYCRAPNIANALISPNGDIKEGETVTVMCQEGFGFSDKSAPTAFVATCVKDGTTAAVTVDYRGKIIKP
jgi:hypothetical protein